MRPDPRHLGNTLAGWTAPPRPGPATIEGRHARLERLDRDRHAAALFEANRTDDRIWDYLGYGPFADLASYGAWVGTMAPLDDPCFYAVIDRATGQPGGVASFLRVAADMGTIEVGHICLSPALQHRTAATEAITLMMGWAFAAGYRRFEWKCDALNLPSRRAAARLGFSYEGTFRQHMIVKGRNRDTAWFSVIDAEWSALSAAFDRWLAPENFDADGRQRLSLSDLTRGLRAATDPAIE